MTGALEGRAAVVTGAGSGIGRAIAMRFAAEGADVVASDVDERTLAATAVDSGGRVVAIPADVANPADVQALVDAAVSRFGHLTTMVNNAGISSAGSVTETSVEEFDRIISINLRGTFLGCKYAIPALLAGGGGSVINIGSANSVVAERDLSAYTASKGGVLMLSRSVALDYAQQGIRCNCICPGWVDTPINDPHVQALGGLDAVLASLTDVQPIGRIGRPDEVAAVAVFLASDESSLMTGSAVMVDGGMTAH